LWFVAENIPCHEQNLCELCLLLLSVDWKYYIDKLDSNASV